MKTMKSILAVTFLLLGSICFAQAPGGRQQGPPPIPNDKEITKMVNNLAEEVSLTDTQQASVLKLYQAHFKQVKELTSANARPRKEEMDDLKTNLDKEVKALLTKEQKSKFKAYLKKEESQRPRR